MNFQDAIKSGFSNYVNFASRASRSEFWYWILFCLIAGIITAVLDSVVFPDNDISPLNTLFTLAVIIPNFSVGARRLHDIDRTGWWQLIAFSIIGIILLIYWWVQPSQAGANRFGGNPYGH